MTHHITTAVLLLSLAACAWADLDNPTCPAIGTWETM